VVKPQNRQTVGTPPPDLRLDSMIRECAKTLLLSLNNFGWCRCLKFLGQNETYILYFFPFPDQKSFPSH